MPPTKNQNNGFTPNDVWASTAPIVTGTEHELTLKSGQTCRARKIGMEGLLEAGLVSEVDGLTALVDKKHIRKVRGAKGKADGEEIDTQSLVKDPKGMVALISMTDRALPLIVVSPVVRNHRDEDGNTIPLDDREPGIVYTDQIGVMDKFELFTWSVGQLGGLETFRGDEAAGDVAAVGDGPRVSRPAKRTARGKR